MFVVSQLVQYMLKKPYYRYLKSPMKKKPLRFVKTGLEKLHVNLNSEIPSEKLTVINFMLKNTYENNIHKMRGEDGNHPVHLC